MNFRSDPGRDNPLKFTDSTFLTDGFPEEGCVEGCSSLFSPYLSEV
jgi:hypothetical protein